MVLKVFKLSGRFVQNLVTETPKQPQEGLSGVQRRI